jgi:hypothetical protein
VGDFLKGAIGLCHFHSKFGKWDLNCVWIAGVVLDTTLELHMIGIQIEDHQYPNNLKKALIFIYDD